MTSYTYSVLSTQSRSFLVVKPCGWSKGQNVEVSVRSCSDCSSGERYLSGEGVIHENGGVVKPFEVDDDGCAELEDDWRCWQMNAESKSPTDVRD